MRSRASLGNHPIHPMLVPIPIGAFALTFVGDLAYATSGLHFWYAFAFVSMGIGILGAVAAAPFGLADYLGIPAGTQAKRTATVHLTLNATALVLYVMNWMLRRGGGAAGEEMWPLAFLVEVFAFVSLALSGWLGGRLVFEDKVGVTEARPPGETRPGGPVDRHA